MSAVFRSLAGFNYRVWACGALFSNIGTWMQRAGQDWIVLTELTDRNASAVGIVMGLQFGPQVLLLPISGWAADNLDRRKLLLATQAAMALLALGLGLLTLSGLIQLWHVFVFAFLLGCVSALDAPARQVFVSELVEESHIANAVALNSASFNAGRTIGPAVAGILIGVVGTGWVFLANAASFVPVMAALVLLRLQPMAQTRKPTLRSGGLVEGFRYVRGRPDLRAILAMLFLIGMLGLNFPIFISAMAVKVFQASAAEFGLLSACMAAGSVAGALVSAGRERPGMGVLIGAALFFGCGLAIAAVMPTFMLFGIVLVVIGMAMQLYMTSSNGLVQLTTEPAMRGRVMAIHLALAMGTTPIGGPLVGWIADRFGPRWALGVGAAAGLAAAAIGLRYLVRHGGLQLRLRRPARHLGPSATAAEGDPGSAIDVAVRPPDGKPQTKRQPDG